MPETWRTLARNSFSVTVETSFHFPLRFLINITCIISHAEAITQSTARSSPPIIQFCCCERSSWGKFEVEGAIRSGGALIVTDNECPCNRYYCSRWFNQGTGALPVKFLHPETTGQIDLYPCNVYANLFQSYFPVASPVCKNFTTSLNQVLQLY